MNQLILDPNRLAVLGSVSFYFCGIFLAISFVTAVLLQAGHEVARRYYNKFVVSGWLKRRAFPLSLSEMQAQMPAIGSELFSLPYWQLAGQIGAVIGSQIGDRESTLILHWQIW